MLRNGQIINKNTEFAVKNERKAGGRQPGCDPVKKQKKTKKCDRGLDPFVIKDEEGKQRQT